MRPDNTGGELLDKPVTHSDIHRPLGPRLSLNFYLCSAGKGGHNRIV
jgi:hypothetical protein